MSEPRETKNRSVEGLWTISLVKDFLNAKAWKFEKAPWLTWFTQRGGPDTVMEFIRSRSIPLQLQGLLQELLQHPGETRDYYAEKLKIHPITVSDYFTKLAGLLATHLNQWSVEVPQPANLLTPAVPTQQPPPSNLPSLLTSFIGREEERAIIRGLLQQPHIRLITLTGSGGTGKTRLALQVAYEAVGEFADGIFFVSLASISDPDLVLPTILQTLGVKEVSEQSTLETLRKQLQHKHMLLVLDNFEQVVTAAPRIADILTAAQQVKILITSRILLQIYGEQEYSLPALALPDSTADPPLETLTQFSAIALFVDRAHTANLSFRLTKENASSVRELCAQLDGLPLALELAAARVKYFTPQAILARLRDSLSILTAPTRDRPARQQTLQATISWSCNLLTSAEQTLFTQLAVFVGGCTLEAAQAVCNANQDLAIDVLDGLIALTDKSLLRQQQGTDGEPRFDMLATIHKYALDQLSACGEWQIYQQAHAAYYLKLVECAEPKLTSDEQVQWLNKLEQEHDNVRSALQWALAHRQWEIALRMSGALWEFWYARGYFREGRQWLAQSLQGVSFVAEEVSVGAIYAEGILATAQGNYASAITSLERARKVYQALGRKTDVARAIHALGHVAWNERKYDRATRLYQQSLSMFQELNDLRGIGDVTHNLGMIAFDNQDYKTARRYLEESLAIARKLDIPLDITLTLIALGSTAYWEKDYAEAVRLYNESLLINQHLGDQDCLILILESFGFVAHDLGDFETAAHVFGAAGKLRAMLGLPADTPVHDIQRQKIAHAHNQCHAQWERWWSEGQAVTATQVVEYARERLQVALQTEGMRCEAHTSD